ncbi:hypothetical protein P8452_13007 [Trifolium repens]|nr:hypothetical protein P8452_13007 [Trifolium repens]
MLTEKLLSVEPCEKIREQEEALHELRVKEEKVVLGTHALLASGEETNTSRSRLEGISPFFSNHVSYKKSIPVRLLTFLDEIFDLEDKVPTN